MVRVIVNADDIGMTAGVTSGIIRAIIDGIATSATFMASMPDAEAAAERIVEHRLDVGVHLNLTQHRPLSPRETVASLVDDRGEFLRPGALRERLRRGRVSPPEIEAEFERQIERTKELGIEPTHLDTHHHMHGSLTVARAMYRVAVRHGIRRVRTLRSLDPVGPAARAASDRSRASRRGGRRPAVAMPIALLRPGDTVDDWRRTLEAVAGLPDAAVFEVVCHPAEIDAELVALSRYAETRERELEVLTSPALAATAARLGISLVSFRAMGA